jgi:tRNA threonylcarbamoyl adenosine modification protein YeaZ
MILFIDTSSPSVATVAMLDGDSRREFSMPRLDRELLKEIVRSQPVGKVAVASGPGSFTGLRVGVSFGLGLAMGLGIPIVPLPSLDLQAARLDAPATAIVEAGRGRYYFKLPADEARLDDPAVIPATYPLVGNVADRRTLLAAGHRFVPDTELRSVAEASEILLRTAREVPYRNLEIEYMQSFTPRK